MNTCILITYFDLDSMSEAKGLCDSAQYEIVHVINQKFLQHAKFGSSEGIIDELKEIMYLAKKSMSIISNALNSDGFNFGLNIGKCAGAGIDDHIHFHIVPRWNGDNNFMPVSGISRVIVQGLKDTYDTLYPFFKKISK